jgi:radical SAM protein with 4Fe4S-binding SPASM domain
VSWMRAMEAALRLPDLAVRGRFAFTFDDVPLAAGRIPWPKRLNLLAAGLDMLRPPGRVLSAPPAIQIEPTNACNLRCPLCPTGAGTCRRPTGYMDVELVERLLDELEGSLLVAILYGWGEPFLHPRIADIVRACTSRGVLALTSTNGQFLQSVEEALEVVDSRLTSLIIAMDGSTQETYGGYRKRGDVEKVERCAAAVEEAKARLGSPLPYTNLRAVVTRANEADLAQMESFARDVGVNMFSCRTLACLCDADWFDTYNPTDPALRRYRYDGRARRRRRRAAGCPYPFRQPTVFWDGTVVGCEFDYNLEAPLGRVGREPFARIWNGGAARRLRQATRTLASQPEFCSHCPYRDRFTGGSVVFRRELRPAR